MKKLGEIIKNNLVPIMFIIIITCSIPVSGYSLPYIINEVINRLGKYSFLILSLLIPIMAGMGLNFGMTLGAMATEIALILISDWQIWGIPALILAAIIATPISCLFGWFCGKILNLAKSREMVTSYIVSYFMNGVYMLIVLFGMGSVIPIKHTNIKLPRGYGIRNSVSLLQSRQCLDNALAFNIGTVKIPVLTLIVIIVMCLFIVWFRKTKLGQDMRAVGQDMEVARAAGIDVDRTRIIAMILSTVMASFGMIIYLQNMGSIQTYSSHSSIGLYSIAALLVGGASVDKADIKHVFIGVVLFHTMFLLAPSVGTVITGSSMTGEYFRVFISYGIITLALVMYEAKKNRQKSNTAKALANAQKEKEAK